MVYLMMGDEREKKGWHRWVSRIDGFFFALWLATFNVLEFSSRAFLYIRSFEFFSFHFTCHVCLVSRLDSGICITTLLFLLFWGPGFFFHSIVYFLCNFGGQV